MNVFFALKGSKLLIIIGHMKKSLFGVLTIAMYTTPKSAFFICPGHMKNALFGVVYIAIVKHQRMHSSYEQVLPPCSVCKLENKHCFKNKHYIIQMTPLDLPMSPFVLHKQEWNGLIDIDTDGSRDVFITTRLSLGVRFKTVFTFNA